MVEVEKNKFIYAQTLLHNGPVDLANRQWFPITRISRPPIISAYNNHYQSSLVWNNRWVLTKWALIPLALWTNKWLAFTINNNSSHNTQQLHHSRCNHIQHLCHSRCNSQPTIANYQYIRLPSQQIYSYPQGYNGYPRFYGSNASVFQ